MEHNHQHDHQGHHHHHEGHQHGEHCAHGHGHHAHGEHAHHEHGHHHHHGPHHGHHHDHEHTKSESMDGTRGKTFDELADSFERIPGVHALNKMIHTHLTDTLATSFAFDNDRLAKAQVLDIGCGPGVLARLMAPQVGRFVGLDASGPMVQAFEKRTTAHHPNATARHTKLTKDSAAELIKEFGGFDVVVCAMSLHHIEDPAAALADMRAALGDRAVGGVVCVFDFDAPFFPAGEEEEAKVKGVHHAHGFSKEALTALMSTAGLEMRESAAALSVELWSGRGEQTVRCSYATVKQ